jgi:hypothetical protein
VSASRRQLGGLITAHSLHIAAPSWRDLLAFGSIKHRRVILALSVSICQQASDVESKSSSKPYHSRFRFYVRDSPGQPSIENVKQRTLFGFRLARVGMNRPITITSPLPIGRSETETGRLPPDMPRGVCAVLQNHSEHIRLLYARAAEAKRRAGETTDRKAKADLLNSGKRWLLLAQSYECSDELNAFIYALGRPRSIGVLETQMHHKDGQSLDIATTASPVKNADGRIVGTSKISRDTTYRRQAQGRMAADLEVMTMLCEVGSLCAREWQKF